MRKSTQLAISGLSLYGREIVVVGFGPVGQGVALRARDLGANVTVVDLDPVRLIQAQHHGCRVADFDDAVRRASVVVTATGFDGVVGAAQIERLPDGAILMNVGHSHREIDVDWLDQHPRTDLRRHLERYEVNGRRVHLLNRGSLVNLAAGLGTGAPQRATTLTPALRATRSRSLSILSGHAVVMVAGEEIEASAVTLVSSAIPLNRRPALRAGITVVVAVTCRVLT